jgi:dipeptidyl aminopeptidase/acylaminoacyl peptidase
MKTRIVLAVVMLGLALPAVTFAQKRGLTTADVYNIKDVRDPQRSPDGKWVAYVVARAIKDTDKNDSDLWMASWDGTQEIQLTSSPDGESQPRWSPDNKYLSFVSSRQGAKDAQLWLMLRAGGEAVKVSDVKGGVSEYAWSPDSKRVVFVVGEPDPRDPQDDDKVAPDKNDKKKTAPPIVIDRYHFKQDVEGYLRNERSHLYLFDVATKKAEVLTPGTLFDEESPVWSPDGTQIAFVSKRGTGDLDRHENTDIWVIDAKAGAQARQVTTSPLPESSPAWSADGKQIAYLTGEDLKYSAYNQNKLMIVPAAGGQPRTLAESLDRPIRQPVWEEGATSLACLVVDDRSQYPARVSVKDGKVQRIVTAKSVMSNLSAGVPDGSYAALVATDTEPAEVGALEGGPATGSGQAKVRRLSHQNDAWLKDVQLGTTEEFTAKSKDGTEVRGLIVKPGAFQAGRKYPTLLRIHGGPNGQDEHAFSFERELFAANGYVVVATNYRGSNGRGSAYQKAIFADWGGKEVVDLLGAMDHVQTLPFVDADRLGIGGWSYGGILTDYTIATDGRFKAATSGAGSALQLTMYGVDEYITQYENEIGPPWKSPDTWIKISYPFFHADRIKTPTLFLGGDKDFNVPLVGGEQMYQALKSLGVDTQLVIYPGQFHGITTPTYKIDRYQRYLDWYDKYLKAGKTTATSAGK